MTEEFQLGIGHLQVLFVDTVNNEHIILRKLQTTSFYETKSHQLQADNVVTLHLQTTSQRHLAVTHLHRELHL